MEEKVAQVLPRLPEHLDEWHAHKAILRDGVDVCVERVHPLPHVGHAPSEVPEPIVPALRTMPLAGGGRRCLPPY
jgi:hypothetical protein